MPSTRRLSPSIVVPGPVVLVLAGIAGWLIYSAFTGTGPGADDGPVLAEAVAARSPRLTGPAVAITTLGSTAAMAVLAVVVGLVLWVRHRRAEAVFLIGTMVSASAVFTLIKRILDRPRPPVADQLVSAGNESLPSGHATMSMAVVGALVVLAWPTLTPGLRLAAVVVAGSWIAAVGFTRIYLGVHWFSDVLAGWALGAAWLAVCTTALIVYRHRRVAVH